LRHVSHRDGGWCRAPLVHSYRELPAACRTMTWHRNGEWCRAPFARSYRELPAAYRTVTGYRLGLCVFPYLSVNVLVESCNALQLSGRGRRGQMFALVWSCPCLGMQLSKTGAPKNRAATPHCHGATPASLP